MQVKLTSMDNLIDLDTGNATVKTATFSLGAMNTMETKKIDINLRLNTFAAISSGKTPLLVEYTDGTFTDFEILYLPINTSSPVVTSNTTLSNMGYSYGARTGDLPFCAYHFYDDLNSYALSYRYGNFGGQIGVATQVFLYRFNEFNGTIAPSSFILSTPPPQLARIPAAV
jgi:hypothetical protein